MSRSAHTARRNGPDTCEWAGHSCLCRMPLLATHCSPLLSTAHYCSPLDCLLTTIATTADHCLHVGEAHAEVKRVADGEVRRAQRRELLEHRRLEARALQP